MSENCSTFEVRDLREKEFFAVDNAFLDGKWLRLLKGCPTAVYFALCRHVDRQQVAFPSESYLAEETGYGERQVRRAVKTLETHRLIGVSREKRDHNIYSLLNRKHWRKTVVAEQPKQKRAFDKGDPYMKGTTEIPMITPGNPLVED